MSFPLEMVLETLEREVSTYQVPVVDLIATQTPRPVQGARGHHPLGPHPR